MYLCAYTSMGMEGVSGSIARMARTGTVSCRREGREIC